MTSLKKIRNDITNFVLTDSKIYFASHFDSKIGVLDRATKELTWQYNFQKEEGIEPRIMELQGNENLLGALSSQGTLYIFEREENTQTIAFSAKITHKELKSFLNMANYLDALLLIDGKTVIDQQFIEELEGKQ